MAGVLSARTQSSSKTQSGSEVIPCKSCKWCELRPVPLCFHPLSFIEQTNYFTGMVKQVPQSVTPMRAMGACKPEAVLFEPIS